MKIAHISDVHIRNLKYHADYRRVFDNLYSKLEEIQPDIVVNTGDTAHTKTQISPEFVQLCSEHIRRIAEIAPYHILLGNHDLNLVNPSRIDAVSPIVDIIDSPSVVLHKSSGVHRLDHDHLFYVFSCADKKNYPSKDERFDRDEVKIGLYHGAVRRSVTDSDWELKETDVSLSFFDGLDFVLLGDIHKHQFLDDDRRVAYAGSLIQQNFGEDTGKGFLLWDIRSRDDFDVEHISLPGARRFFTVKLAEDLSVPDDVEVEPGARIRIVSDKPFTLAEKQSFESEVWKKFGPTSVISIPPQNVGKKTVSDCPSGKSVSRNLRDIEVQESLIREFLSDSEISDEVFEKIFEINKRLQVVIDKSEESTRDVFWKMEKIVWSNMFNYGEDNVIDFSKIKGVTGIFAPNSSGKSSLIDIIVESLFDKTTKPISKNISLINDNKQKATMLVEMAVGRDNYIIERNIERIKHGARSGDVKEWGKTSLDFYTVDDDGERDRTFNGELRPQTERNIRSRIGSFEDFSLTALLAQNRDTDIINCKETDRKKILYRFMDLDIFEQKGFLAKEEGREHLNRLKSTDLNLDEILTVEIEEMESILKKIEDLQWIKEDITIEIRQIREEISDLLDGRVKVSCDEDETAVVERLNTVKICLGDLETERDSLLSSNQNLSDRLSEINAETASIPVDEHNEAMQKWKKLSDEHTKLTAMSRKAQSEVENKRSNIKLLDTVPCGDMFPQCRFLERAFKQKDELPSVLKKQKDFERKLSELSSELARIRLSDHKEQVAKFEALSSEASDIERDLSDNEHCIELIELKLEAAHRDLEQAQKLSDDWEKSQDVISKNIKIDKEVSSLRERLGSLESRRDVMGDEIVELSKSLGSKESLVKSIREEIKELQELAIVCDAYEYYIAAMGKYGIAYNILVDRLPLINQEINKILSSVTDFNVFIEHDMEEQTIRLYLQYGDYRARRIELAGGAERMLAAIAIRTALLSITNLPKTNLFIIDEGFGSLDPENTDNMSKMFDYLRSVFDHVLIISHKDELKDMVDNNIEISFDDERYSHVEVI